MSDTSLRQPEEQQRYDLLIVGGGPAALSAAFYARTKQLTTVMLYEELGGKLGWHHRFVGPNLEHTGSSQGTRTLADALSRELLDVEEEALPGNEVIRLLISRTVMQSGLVLHDRALTVSVHDEIFHVETRLHGVLNGTAVVIATGASPLQLDVPGAHHLMGRQLGYSITTYGALIAGTTIAVVGTSRRALRGVAELARTAKHVFLIVPDSDDAKLPMIQAFQRRNVEVLAGYEVKEVIGTIGIEGLAIERDGTIRRIDVDRAFIDLGLVPHSELVRGLVELDREGFIVVDDANQTTVPGLFAAGDVTTAFCEQVLIAVGDGTRAAANAYDYLLGRGLEPVRVAPG